MNTFKKDRKDYYREYSRKNSAKTSKEGKVRYRKNKSIIVEKLGGKCVKCGCDDKRRLQFDHIDPNTKVMPLSRMLRNHAIDNPKLLLEIDKCQLLCKTCHYIKTKENYEYTYKHHTRRPYKS